MGRAQDLTFLQRCPELIQTCCQNYCIFEASKCWWTTKIEAGILELPWQRSEFGGSEYSGKKGGFLHEAREITDPVSLQVLGECLHSNSKKCTSQSEESSHHWDLNGDCLCRPGSMTRQGAVELGSLVSAKVIRFQNTSKEWWPLTVRNKVGIITVVGNETRMTNSGPWPK